MHIIEILTPLTSLSIWLIGWFIFKKNLLGFILAGAFLGIFFEIATEPNWNYHLNIYLYKDVSPFIMWGWGNTITIVVLISDWFYKKIFGKTELRQFDKKLFITDFIVGTLIFTFVEFIGVNVLHGWSYNPVLGWSIIIPYINLPLEAVVGLGLFSLALPTFVRHWHTQFNFSKK